MITAKSIEGSTEVDVKIEGDPCDILSEVACVVESLTEEMSLEGRKLLWTLLEEAMQRGSRDDD